MGWQEDQAARAREQQRQSDQRAASARQAESIRQENDARNRANRAKANADMFAANARRDAERNARDKAASDKAHADRMADLRRNGQNNWSAQSFGNSRAVVSEPARATAASYPAKKKGNGGWLLVFLIVGGIYVLVHSGSSSSGTTEQTLQRAQIVDGPSQPPANTKQSAGASDTATTQDTPATSTNDSNAQGPTAATDATTEGAQNSTQLALPRSTALEPIDRPNAVYPAEALATRPTGPVIVVIGVQTNGAVVRVTPESGDSLLMPAAIDAAKQWTFKPYPYEPGASIRTMRIEFPFTPPASYTLPQSGVGTNYTLPTNGGFGPNGQVTVSR